MCLIPLFLATGGAFDQGARRVRRQQSGLRARGGAAHASQRAACELHVRRGASTLWQPIVGLAGEAAPAGVEVQEGAGWL